MIQRKRFSYAGLLRSSRLVNLVPVLPLLPLLVSYDVFEEIVPSVGGATAQKALFVVLLAMAAILIGVRIPPMPVIFMGGAVAVGAIVGVIADVRQEGGAAAIATGAVGLVYSWLIFCVDWRRVSAIYGATILAVFPIAIIGVSLVLHPIWPELFQFFRNEYTGAARVSAGLPPAYLAGIGLVASVAALWVWTLRRWWGVYLALIDAAIVASTGTRGATACVALVVVVVLVCAVVVRLPHWIPAIVISALGAVGASMVLLPTMLERIVSTSGSDNGGFGGSGRGNAWEYYWHRILEHPLIGHGPGSGPYLAEQATDNKIRVHFISPHNEYLRVLADIGFPLAIVFFGGMLAILVNLVVRAKREFRVLIVVSSIAFLSYGAFDNLLNAPQVAVGFVLLLALFWSHIDRRVSFSKYGDPFLNTKDGKDAEAFESPK